jgi:hypothetical protein
MRHDAAPDPVVGKSSYQEEALRLQKPKTLRVSALGLGDVIGGPHSGE